MLERVAAEEVEIGGQTMSMQEIELRSIQRKATKGDVAASRPLAKLRADAGVDKGPPHSCRAFLTGLRKKSWAIERQKRDDGTTIWTGRAPAALPAAGESARTTRWGPVT